MSEPVWKLRSIAIGSQRPCDSGRADGIGGRQAAVNPVDAMVRQRPNATARTLRTTLTETFGTINAANLKRAHALIESGTARGKIVLDGF